MNEAELVFCFLWERVRPAHGLVDDTVDRIDSGTRNPPEDNFGYPHPTRSSGIPGRLLETRVPEEKLAATFEALQHIPDVKDMAVTMQKYQRKLWIDRGEDPICIGKLLGIRHTTAITTERGQKDEILSAFTKMYYN
ncbi:hypothetical protein ON010_g2874 [Phytophthora cinnamomi]|nr:hypothetical protein ON010_g2874 [Phytophthora cinnamomi]